MGLLNLSVRNLAIFFKDIPAVLLSFFAEMIIIVLYALFMRDQLITGLSQVEHADLLMDVWMVAGILGITSVTTTMGAYGVMVDDKVKKINRDFHVSPIRNFTLLSGYLSAAIIIGLLLSFFTLVASEAYLFFRYGFRLGAGCMLNIYAAFVLITLSNASQVLLLVSFINSSNALAGCSTILGSLIGFMTGIYLPIGSIPRGVQLLVKCCPISHGVVLLRQLLMEPLIGRSFGGTDTAAALTFKEYMGVRYTWNGNWLSVKASVLILSAMAVVCLLLSMIKFSIPKKQ